MLESIWENNSHKTIAKQQINKQFSTNTNFSNTLNNTLKKDPKENHFPTPNKTEYGPSFSNKQLSDKNIPTILKKLQDQPHSKVLFLAKNNITDIGLDQLAKQLKKNTHIKHLILSQNNICLNEFCKAAIMDLLKVNHYIGWLVLNGNNINDIGAENLSDALAENKSVIHLVLSDNKITDKGLKILIKKLKRHPNLQSIFIDNNQLTSESISELEEFIKNSQTIKILSIKGINIKHPSQLSALRVLCSQKNIRLHV